MMLTNLGKAVLLLNANITFLSIPSIDDSDDDKMMHSVARIAIYISIAGSFGAIALGLLHLRQYRTKVRDSAGEAVSTCRTVFFFSLFDTVNS
jgi:hypothetical protein